MSTYSGCDGRLWAAPLVELVAADWAAWEGTVQGLGVNP